MCVCVFVCVYVLFSLLFRSLISGVLLPLRRDPVGVVYSPRLDRGIIFCPTFYPVGLECLSDTARE